MAKAVFRPDELTSIGPQIMLAPPTSFEELSHLAPDEEEVEELSPQELYTGPTADDLRREAEAFKAQWTIEKEALINSTRAEADRIIAEA
ncbi:MAG: flagellar assembly protein FliH, partial [Treponema sp.]|nr:flagellar assembly protein FliH [Treponema sp.]